MSQPTAYNPAHEFLEDEGANPNFPGSEIDIEFNALKRTTDQTRANLALMQRADGQLQNGIVSADALDTVLAAALGDLEAVATVAQMVTDAEAAAVAALASQTAAGVSASAALASQTAAASSASSASTSASTATTQAGTATTQAGIATTQAGLASTSATNAGTSATNAASSASAASTSAGTASTHATTATTQAGNASTSATNAAASAVAAAASAAAASSSFDSFDDRYLGPYASDPALDNDGNALVVGAIYFNTTTGLKIWNGASWMSYSAVSGDMLKSDNLSGLANYATVRTNLGLTIGTHVQAYDALLLSIAALGTAANRGVYFAGVDTAAEFDLTAAGRAILDDADAPAQRTTLSAAARAQTDFLSGVIGVGANKDFRIIERIPYAITITKIYAKSASGTITLTPKINTTAITSGAINVTSTQGSSTPSAANVMAAGDALVLTGSANSSALDVSVVVEFTKALA